MKKYVGVDVGGTTIKLGIFTPEGILIEKCEIPTEPMNNGTHILKNVGDNIEKKWMKNSIQHSEIVGIGIGMPGPVQKNGYIESCVNLGIQNFNPREILSGRFPEIKISSANDANVAALGEMWKGGGKGYSSLMMVTLGTGVGSGVIIDEQIIYGDKGLSGEIGHIMINPYEKEICNCGGRGCLDQAASATGIVRHTLRILKESCEDSVLKGDQAVTAKEIFQAAKAGDYVANKAVNYCMGFLGKCLAEVSYIIDPQVFVIGGGVSGAGQFLIDIIQNHYNQYAILKKEKAPILLAKLGNDAGIYGAAKMVMP